MPIEVFLRATDIVLAANRKQVEDNRALLDQIKRRYLTERKLRRNITAGEGLM